MNIAIKSCDRCGDDHIMQEIHFCWDERHVSIEWVCERCMKQYNLQEIKDV